MGSVMDAVTDRDTAPTRKTHVCEPHPADVDGGWTNCHHCFKPIRVEGDPGSQCRVIVPWSGRCELRFGHTGRHSISGILFNF